MNTIQGFSEEDKSAVRNQYLEYPYPPVNPKDDLNSKIGKVVSLDPNNLNNYLYGGKMNYTDNFRILIAGGGTGTSTIYHAFSAQSMDIRPDIVYLGKLVTKRDFSFFLFH